MLKIYLFCLILFSFNSLYSVQENFGIDTVYSFHAGLGQNIGQDSINFPNNIFGMPLITATANEPASSEKDILSIGKGGEIIVGFKNRILKNIDGPDFVIYENAMQNGVNGKIFAEPAIISVSQDGLEFFEFPYNSKTFEGLAGRTPTTCNGSEYNFLYNGGDSFDLDKIGLDYITHIKIKDAYYLIDSLEIDSKYESPAFLMSGFDLDAVIGLRLESKILDITEDRHDELTIFVNNQCISLKSKQEINEYQIIDILGNCIESGKVNFTLIDLKINCHGLYFLRLIETNGNSIIRKIVL